jgi:hypothetical protein
MCRILSIAVAFITGSLGLDAQVSTRWISRYSGPTNTQEFPRAMTVDAAGNAYVAAIQSPEGMPNMVTIKYGPTGAQAWVNIYGTDTTMEYPTDIEVDSAGNVYVYAATGNVAHSDLALFKFNSAGVQQWMRTFDGAIHDYPGRATIDGAGNIYLTGVRAFSSSSQFLTLKYDPAGNLLWSSVYPGGGQVASGNLMSDVAVNASGEVCVTGVFYAPTALSTFVVKYDSNGALLWSATFVSASFSQRIMVDDPGNVYVGTAGTGVPPSELLVRKYNPTGTLLWVGAYDSPAASETLNDMAVDPAGNVYLTGTSAGSVANDVVTVKFNAAGTRQWVSRYNNPVANSYDFARRIAVDSAGSVYVGGYTYGNGSQQDFLALKYDANGNQKWVFTYDQDGSPDFLYDFALSTSGDVFLTGSADFLNTGNDILTLRLEQTAVTGLPEILVGPRDVEVIVGQPDVTFAVVVAESSTPLTYQWRFNGRDIPGATQQSYTVTSPDPGEAGEYSVRVSNAAGVTVTPEARLTVRRPPTVSIFTATPNVVEGRTVAIDGFFDGDLPMRFQWRFNGADLVGQTNLQLRLTGVTTNNAGSYALVARNAWGDSISNPLQINVSPRGAIDRWTWRSPLPQGNELTEIAYGNGRYVAVGVEGTIVVSTNGRDWSVHTAEYGNFSSITFGKGLFTSLADGFLYTSPDGITWTHRLLPTSGRYNISHLAFGAGRFVGAGNALISSDDGISWIERATNVAMGFTTALTYGNDSFLIHTSTGILTSSNGIDWLLQHTGGALPSLAAGNGVLVAHDYGRLLLSTDGSLSWQPVLQATNNNYFHGVRFANGQFYALGTQLLTSTDGLNWTERIPQREGGMRLTSAAGGPGQTVVVGDEGVIFASTDGATFGQVGGGTRNNLRSLVYANNRFTLVGNDGVIWTSTDGISFAEVVSPTTNNLRAIAFGHGTYVVVGDAGTVLTSRDAVAWQSLGIVTNDLYGIAFANGHFTAVGDLGSVLVSTNAANWALANLYPGERLQGVAYGAGRYVTTGRRGFYANSTNALNWNAGRNESMGYLESIVYANGLFVAVGANGRIFTSADGVQWTPRLTSSFPELESVIYVPGQFIAAGDRGTLMTSSNAIDWVEHRFLTRNSFRQIVYARGALWGVGNNEMVVKSGQLQPYLTLRPGPLSGRLVEVLAEPGQIVELQASDNLANWESLARGPASADGTFTHIDPAQRPRRFYRVAP